LYTAAGWKTELVVTEARSSVVIHQQSVTNPVASSSTLTLACGGLREIMPCRKTGALVWQLTDLMPWLLLVDHHTRNGNSPENFFSIQEFYFTRTQLSFKCAAVIAMSATE